MMKKLVSLALALLLASSAGCGAREPAYPGADMSVETDGFSLSEVEGKTVVAEICSQYDYMKLYPNAKALCAESRIIAVGTVTDVAFSDASAEPETYYDFKFEDVWEGVFVPGDIITVVRAGGYIRGDVYNSFYGGQPVGDGELVLQGESGVALPCVGDRYVLFLQEYENNMYAALGSFMGLYSVEGKNVYRHIPESEERIFEGMTYDKDTETLSGMKKVVLAELKRLQEGVSVTTFEDIRNAYTEHYVENAGSGVDADAQSKYVACYDEIIRLVGDTAKGAESRPSVLLLDGDNKYYAAGSDTFAASLIELAGGVNAAGEFTAKGNYSKITAEQIKRINPDYIFLASGRGFSKWIVLKDSELQETAAVKNGNVFTIPYKHGTWVFPMSTGDQLYVCLGAAYILHKLHPELYSEEQLRAAVDQVYAREAAAFGNEWTPIKSKELF